MNDAQSVGKYWLVFFISAIILILLLVFIRPYFWMALPFVLTSFGKGMRII